MFSTEFLHGSPDAALAPVVDIPDEVLRLATLCVPDLDLIEVNQC